VKPENFLVRGEDPASADFRIVVSDFGLSKNIEEEGPPTTDVGSDPFKAPEVKGSRSSSAYTVSADSWSAGVTLWVLVTGRTPFEGKNAATSRENQAAGRLHFDKDTWKALPRVSEIIQSLVVPVKRVNTRTDAPQDANKPSAKYDPIDCNSKTPQSLILSSDSCRKEGTRPTPEQVLKCQFLTQVAKKFNLRGK
jgi:serine/threonine protein kinase